jgi:propionyl-CoA carboxylase alpha chain
MAHPRWRDGRLSTSFIPEEYPNGFNGISPDSELSHHLAMVALWMELDRRIRLARASDPASSMTASPQRHWVVATGDATIPLEVGVIRSDGGLAVDMHPPASGEAVTVASDWRPGEPIWSGTIGAMPRAIQCRPITGGARLLYRGVDASVRVMTPQVAALAALMPEKAAVDSSNQIRCPMPGLVVAINVSEGQQVRAGEAIAIVEAMKMENVLRAERDATVAKITASPGDILAVDDVIVELE